MEENLEDFGKEELPPMPIPAQEIPKVYGDERDTYNEKEFIKGRFNRPREVNVHAKQYWEKQGTRDPHHAINLNKEERAAEIFDLKKAGWSERELAKKFDLSPGTISKIIAKELDRVAKRTIAGAKQHKQLQLERLDFLLKSLHPNVAAGNYRAIEMYLKVEERRAKLLGLDEPEKKSVEINVEFSSDRELIELAMRNGLAIPTELKALVEDAPLPISDKESVDGEIIDVDSTRTSPDPEEGERKTEGEETQS
jgi:lambda repressor-like predicted transcriptional regulator